MVKDDWLFMVINGYSIRKDGMERGDGKRESRHTIVLTIVNPFLITLLESVEEFLLELQIPTFWLRQRRVVIFVFLGNLFGAQCVGELPS